MRSERDRAGGVYDGMIERCYDPRSKSYRNYGARGIKVDHRWLNNRKGFVEWALANGSAPGLQLDRIDNEGDYSPENCRFVTPLENNDNKRNLRTVTAFGETRLLAEWMRLDITIDDYGTVARRIDLGWDAERALTEPVEDRTTMTLTAQGQTKTWREWVNTPGIIVNENTLKTRIQRGWSDEEALGLVERKRKAPNAKTITAWGVTKDVHAWMEDDRVTLRDPKAIWQRVNTYKWRPEDAFKAEIKRKPKV